MTPPPAWEAARQAFEANNSAEAEARVLLALEQDPNFFPALSMLSLIEEETGRNGVPHAEQAVEISGRHFSTVRRLIFARLHANQDLDTTEALLSEIEDQVEPSMPPLVRSLLSARRGDAARVLTHLDQIDCTTELGSGDCATGYTLGSQFLDEHYQARGVTRSPAEYDMILRRAETHLPELGARLRCQAAMRLNDARALRSAAQHWLRINPQSGPAHAYLAMVEQADGNYEAAQNELSMASSNGLDATNTAHLRASFDENTPFYAKWWKAVAFALLIWIGGIALLFALGSFLSAQTLKAVQHPPPDLKNAGRASGINRALLLAYRNTIRIAAAYYYVSLPFVVLLIIAIFGGGIALFFAIGRIPIKLVLIMVVIGCVSLWAVLKGLFLVLKPQPDPGPVLDLSKHPKLRAVLEDASSRVGTRMVDTVFLVAGTSIAVFERRTGAGERERCLILGAAVLDTITVREMRSILAHEYGHFRNEDTAGGGIAIRVRASIARMADAMIAGGAATWMSPGWWFVSGYSALFLRITQGASRLQEILADRWAAMAYGSDASISSERSLIRATVEHRARFDRTLKDALDGGRPVANFFRYEPVAQGPSLDDLEKRIEDEFNREPTIYDGHPAPRDRVALVAKLAAPDVPLEHDGELSWVLFEDREAIEKMMSEEIRAHLANAGFVVRAIFGEFQATLNGAQAPAEAVAPGPTFSESTKPKPHRDPLDERLDAEIAKAQGKPTENA